MSSLSYAIALGKYQASEQKMELKDKRFFQCLDSISSKLESMKESCEFEKNKDVIDDLIFTIEMNKSYLMNIR